LGLGEIRFRASEEDIKKACTHWQQIVFREFWYLFVSLFMAGIDKKQVLKYHPDKRGNMNADQLSKTEAQFNCIVKGETRFLLWRYVSVVMSLSQL
jgi:hypothetical protein